MVSWAERNDLDYIKVIKYNWNKAVVEHSTIFLCLLGKDGIDMGDKAIGFIVI